MDTVDRLAAVRSRAARSALLEVFRADYRAEFTDDPVAIAAKDDELRAAPEADDVHLLLQNLVSASEA